MESQEHHNHPTYVSNVWVWVTLLVLTIITVTVASVDLQKLTVAVALLVATVKALVVAIYFMHLKFDSKILSIFFGVVMIVFLSFILLTFFDYGFR